MKYSEQQKMQMVRDAEDEIGIQQNGVTCAPRHVKLYCRNRIRYLDWVIGRVQRNLPITNPPASLHHIL
jgi:hypothetical protein